MRTLVHLSDLHFGDVDARTLEPLTRIVGSLAPDIVVVSGDLTQRARPRQFRQARAFLDGLPGPQVVVPGNHDIPLVNLLARFAAPLARYRSAISADVEPSYIDAEVAVIGLNSARSGTWKAGRLNEEQLASARLRLTALPDSIVKVVVTHHPLDLPPGGRERDVVGRARKAMAAFADARVDVFLSGHLHVGHAGRTSERFPMEERFALVVHAGTATSNRQRGEENSFNLLRLQGGRIGIVRFSWSPEGGAFLPQPEERWERCPRGWEAA